MRPAGSTSAEYCQVIKDLMWESWRYQEFRANARLRYEDVMDWENAGHRFVGLIREAVGEG